MKRGPLASGILEGLEEFENCFDSFSSCGVGLETVSSWLLFLYNPCDKPMEMGEDEEKGDTLVPGENSSDLYSTRVRVLGKCTWDVSFYSSSRQCRV